jgi:DNA-directed RNA polymerase subunit RPC12/RpoP
MACGATFQAAPREGTVPPGGAVEAKKYSCDGCGALMLFDAETGALKCPFCSGTKGIERDASYVPVEHALEGTEVHARDEAPKVFHCDNCGAEVAFRGETISAACAFCGSDHVVERRGDPHRIRPESVVAFKISLGAARARWKTWIGKGWFRPRALKDLAAVEALKGVYLPFWTYDTDTWSRWTAMAGYHYTVRVGKTTVVRTRWVPAAGERRGTYDDVLICASRGADLRLLEKAYPYRLAEAQPYRSEFLSGWGAEEYSVDLREGWNRALLQVNEEERRRCSRDVPGQTQMDLRVWTQHANVTWKHVLLPLWIAAYRFREKRYAFLVNGQTGEVAGRAPVSILKVAIAVVVAAAVGLAAYFLLRDR